MCSLLTLQPLRLYGVQVGECRVKEVMYYETQATRQVWFNVNLRSSKHGCVNIFSFEQRSRFQVVFASSFLYFSLESDILCEITLDNVTVPIQNSSRRCYVEGIFNIK